MMSSGCPHCGADAAWTYFGSPELLQILVLHLQVWNTHVDVDVLILILFCVHQRTFSLVVQTLDIQSYHSAAPTSTAAYVKSSFLHLDPSTAVGTRSYRLYVCPSKLPAVTVSFDCSLSTSPNKHMGSRTPTQNHRYVLKDFQVGTI